jgi:hypothetical protein
MDVKEFYTTSDMLKYSSLHRYYVFRKRDNSNSKMKKEINTKSEHYKGNKDNKGKKGAKHNYTSR